MMGKIPGPLAARTPVQILASGNVPSAKFTINGQSYEGGRFRKLPLGLRLNPGKHLIIASRPGYYSASAQVAISRGDYLKEIPLKFRAKSKLTSVKVAAKWATGPSVVVNVDHGFQVVKIATDAKGTSESVTIDDLQRGTEYSVTAAVAEHGQKKEVQCRFVPPETQDRQEALLQIDFIEKKCTMFVKSI